jgi:hypothetical protein
VTDGPRASVKELQTKLAIPAADGVFSERELDGLPAPVRRYLGAAIAPGAPLASSARLEMRGSIKLGKRWLPFRAHQVLAPHHGGVWAARVAGVVSGADQYAGGRGWMQWKLFGLVSVVRAEGPDVTRSAAGRFGGEAIWVPTTLLPRFGVTWMAASDVRITASFSHGNVDLTLDIMLDDDAHIRSVTFDRWGDPDNIGTSAIHPFGIDVTAYRTLGELTIPSSGRGGWFHGTDRWDEGEFFRYEITSLEPVPASA